MLEYPSAYHCEIDSPSILYATNEIKQCLQECYQIDDATVKMVLNKMRPLIENVSLHTILREFIDKSKKLNIQFSVPKLSESLPKDDAILRAPKWHEIIYESPYVRVLWLNAQPGDHEPFHTHHWKSLLLIIQGSQFEIENSDGSTVNDIWDVGVYELPSETEPASYSNVGSSEFKALRFEIK